MERSPLKAWEKAVLLLAMVMFLVSGYLFATDFPLRKYLFGIDDQAGLVRVGELASKTGSLKRQIVTESDFKSLGDSAELYNYDVIVTGEDGRATLKLGEGTVELEPNTMVKLTFETKFGLDGINRKSRLEIITGDAKPIQNVERIVIRKAKPNPLIRVAAQPVAVPVAKPSFVPIPSPSPVLVAVAKPSPSPSPSPMVVEEDHWKKIRILSPAPGSHLVVDKGSRVAQKLVPLTWSMYPDDANSLVTVWKVEGRQKKEVLKEVIGARRGRSAAAFTATSPGEYAWKISAVNGDQITYPKNGTGRFIVDPEFEGVKLLDHLIAGKAASDNALHGDLVKNFDITLRWEPFPGISGYTLWFGRSPTDAKPLLQKFVDKTEYHFNKNKVYSGAIYYKVSGKLANGFVATSGVQLFQFKFLPPALVVPEDKLQVSKDTMQREDNSLLFTWQKTNFTEGYEIEIARDAAFKQRFFKQVLKENFFVMPAPPPGKYFWRVRSYSKELSSPMSKPNEFDVLP